MHDTLNQPAARLTAYPDGFQLLYPLDTFYTLIEANLPAVEAIDGQDVPEPYRSLLVHKRDMTPTLETFHGDRIELRVLDRHLEGDAYSRLVDLTLIGTGEVVEFGAIMIDLALFPPVAREIVLQGHVPLGTILAEYEIEHESCPQSFITLDPDAYIQQALDMEHSERLYGRRNWLVTADDRRLADILELLPPSRP
jgi:chorismate-pyruvate lyase